MNATRTTATTVNQAMQMLADKGAIFVGQNVCYDGAWPYDTLDGVPLEQRIEMPVAEELQLGICTGLALQGFLTVSCYPRMDFLMRAMDQLVNHLDKIEAMSCGQFKPRVVIRTRVGPKEPLHAGPQHTQDHTEGLQSMLKSVLVIRLTRPEQAMPMYRMAAGSPRSTLMVEAF